jgi:meiosis-specific transcription factor NDT80
MGMGGPSSILPSTGYGGGYDSRSHQYRANIPPLQIPLEPTLSAEDDKNLSEAPGYSYYPGAIYENFDPKYQLPSVTDYNIPKVKHESSFGGWSLPSLTSTDSLSRHCGRWEGVPESKGFFPTALMQHEMNIT